MNTSVLEKRSDCEISLEEKMAYSLLELGKDSPTYVLNLTASNQEREANPKFYKGMLSKDETWEISTLMNELFSIKDNSPVNITTVFSERKDWNNTSLENIAMMVFYGGNTVCFRIMDYPDYEHIFIDVAHIPIGASTEAIGSLSKPIHCLLFNHVCRLLIERYSNIHEEEV